VSRTLARTALTMTFSLLLLAMTALPALAAAATRPDPDANPLLVGSIDQLIAAAVAGAAIGAYAFATRPAGPPEDEDQH
jgi:hypothetical protein